MIFIYKKIKVYYNLCKTGERMKICGIYKITNEITGDFYVGSSKDVKKRWANHKCPSRGNKCPNNPMYIDMRKYGVDNFVFEILAEVEEEKLKETEQQFIETLKPTYNNRNANGLDIERRKKTQKSDKRKKYNKEYKKTEKYKEYQKEYDNQLCCYNGQTITLCALRERFKIKGIPHPTIEAKKYLLH